MWHRERFEAWREVLKYATFSATKQQIEVDAAQAQNDLPGIIPPAPAGLESLPDEAVRRFVERCLLGINQRLRPAELTDLHFEFVADEGLRRIAERNLAELRVAYVAELALTSVILAGAIVECILLDVARTNETSIRQRGVDTSDLDHWMLGKLIEQVSKSDLRVSRVKKLSETVRDYRNLIHPAAENRSIEVKFDEAERAVKIIGMVCNEMAEN
jgi:hypothetical protein